jgi:hypothetical protein
MLFIKFGGFYYISKYFYGLYYAYYIHRPFPYIYCIAPICAKHKDMTEIVLSLAVTKWHHLRHPILKIMQEWEGIRMSALVTSFKVFLLQWEHFI